MDPLQHADQRGVIEGILQHIPGFSGYLEREYRRESDQLARKCLEDKLQSVKQNLDRHLANLVDQGELATLAPGERLKTRIDTLQNKIRSSVRGYSGFFDFVRVDRSRLDNVLALDLALVKAAESIEAASKALVQEKSASQDKLNQLGETIGELDDKFSQRAEILSGITD